MKKNLKHNNKFLILLYLYLFCMVVDFQGFAQTLTVNGRVTTTTKFSVKNASITFIDNADTTNKFIALTDNSGNYQIDVVTSVNQAIKSPDNFKLEQNYPNPFSTSTAIPFQLQKNSDIQVTIYDILGKVVRKFSAGIQTPGAHSIIWDGNNNFGQRVATGIYFYQIQVGSESQVKKMVFNRGLQNGQISLPVPYSSYPAKTNKTENINGNTFTVRIQNISTTIPEIVPQEQTDVFIQNDTTINFAVDYFPTASIDFDSLHQIISGFGGANLFFFGRPDMTSSEVETAFGTGDGQLGFTILRIGIDPNTNNWSSYVTTSQKAYDMDVKIIASPWTPPASMKSNNSLVGGELKTSSYADYAAYLKSFGDYMANSGVSLYSISIQNEPDANVNYQSCDWNASQLLSFCKNNAQSIGYRIMMPEAQNFNHALSDPTLNDSVAASHVSIIAGHIYGGGLGKYPLAEEKGKEVWMTEHLSGENNSGNDWSWAFPVATEINRVMKADMSAYVWWYIVRFYGPISDGTDNSGNKGDVTKKGYVMSQFARFIRPGFYRVESSIYPSLGGVDITAYKDPSSSKIVIVAINSNSSQTESTFRIKNGATTITFTPYTTSESKNCEKGSEINTAGDNFTFTLEPSSITTFVSN